MEVLFLKNSFGLTAMTSSLVIKIVFPTSTVHSNCTVWCSKGLLCICLPFFCPEKCDKCVKTPERNDQDKQNVQDLRRNTLFNGPAGLHGSGRSRNTYFLTTGTKYDSFTNITLKCEAVMMNIL